VTCTRGKVTWFSCDESVVAMRAVFGTKKQSKARQSSPATNHCGAWGERRHSSYSFLTSALDRGEWSASRPAGALPRDKDTQYPLYRRMGGPQCRSGHRGYRKNPSPLPGIEPRSPARPVRGQTVYWLSYLSSLFWECKEKNSNATDSNYISPLHWVVEAP
jgi:hypothetical protein